MIRFKTKIALLTEKFSEFRLRKTFSSNATEPNGFQIGSPCVYLISKCNLVCEAKLGQPSCGLISDWQSSTLWNPRTETQSTGLFSLSFSHEMASRFLFEGYSLIEFFVFQLYDKVCKRWAIPKQLEHLDGRSIF